MNASTEEGDTAPEGSSADSSSAEGSASRPVSAAASWPAVEQPAGAPEVTGRELYIEISYLNHSCDPNCEMELAPEASVPGRGAVEGGAEGARQDPIGRVVAQERVGAGEELNISYINVHQPCSARMKHLKQYYHFHCVCRRCQEEQSGKSTKFTYEKSANRHQGKGAKGKAKVAQNARQKQEASQQRKEDALAKRLADARLAMD